MKLGKSSWILLAVGVSIIAFASLGLVLFRQIDEKDQLDRELSLAQEGLNAADFTGISSQYEELDKQLLEIYLDIEDAKVAFSQPTVSITSSDELFDIARVCDVEVIEISSSDLIPEEDEGINYFFMNLAATVEGEFPNLINFVTKLNDDFESGVVKSVVINIPEEKERYGPSQKPPKEGCPHLPGMCPVHAGFFMNLK